MYILLHSYVNCVYTKLRLLNLFALIRILLEQNVFYPLRVLMITRLLKKLSIGYANICPSVQDHRQKKLKIVIRFWKNKREQSNQQKGSIKASEENCS